MRYGTYEGPAEELIRDQLDQIERSEGVRVLHAVESGSRSWGFVSPDSDYDVRFIYVRTPQDYLTLRPRRKDTIEWVVDETLDICGWDLSKALQLAYKGNLFLFEWAISPVVYRSTSDWGEVWKTVQPYFSPKAALHSYYGIAYNTYQTFLKGERVRYKKYLYALRPLLAYAYIAAYESQPPVAFDQLAAAAAPDELRPALDDLLAAKVHMCEKDEGPRIAAIDAYVESALRRYEKLAAEYPDDGDRAWEPLDAVFLQVLGLQD